LTIKIHSAVRIGFAFILLILACVSLPAQYSLECEWISPQPNSSNYRSIWGSSAANVFLVGQYGAISHYDGSAFTNMPLPAGVTPYDLMGVWGSSAANVYAVGSDMVSGGLILRYNGSAWANVTPTGVNNWLTGVWGASASAVFVVGDATWDPDTYTYSTIIHFFNGTSWTQLDAGTGNVNLNAVWGTAANNVFAVGDSGVILHYDGSSWSSMSSGTGNTLNSVWGASSSDVFAVGDGGVVLHYDGSTWSAWSSPTGSYLYGIWGESASDFYVVGGNGTICHWNGFGWSNTVFWGNRLMGIYGFAGTPYFTAGDQGRVLRCDTGTWGKIAPTGRLTSQHLNGIFGTSATNIYAMGDNGNIFHFNGASWNDESIYGNTSFYRIWGLAADDIYAAAGDWSANPDRYMVYHFDGSSWSEVTSGDGYILYAVWGSSSVGPDGKANDVYAVGGTQDLGSPTSEQYFILHYDGTSWSLVDSGTGFHATGIWGSASVDGAGRADDVFVCGQATNTNGGFIRYFNGTSWSTTPEGECQLMDLWGSPRVGSDGKANDVFAVGYNGRPYHFDGSAWTMMPDYNLSAHSWAAWGAGADNLFVASRTGPAYYDGSAWTERPFVDPNDNGLNDIWGTATDNVYAVGQSGTIIHIRRVGTPIVPPVPVVRNQAPVAAINGETAVCHPPQAVNLDGAASSDPDGRVAAYSWHLLKKPAGSTATLSASDAPAVSFTADLPGDYVVTLMVLDNRGAWSATSSHSINVSAGNPPVLSVQGTRKEERAWIVRKEYAELTLTATPPASGCALPISGYRLQRRQGQGAWVTVREIAPAEFVSRNNVPTLVLIDTYLERRTAYTYRLVALDGSGHEAAAAEITL